MQEATFKKFTYYIPYLCFLRERYVSAAQKFTFVLRDYQFLVAKWNIFLFGENTYLAAGNRGAVLIVSRLDWIAFGTESDQIHCEDFDIVIIIAAIEIILLWKMLLQDQVWPRGSIVEKG